MARYMVPRYVDIVQSLPRTPTEKVEKYRLMTRGVSSTTWDRERQAP
jgi:crotonobetaine/carnitine-CoA ligase